MASGVEGADLGFGRGWRDGGVFRRRSLQRTLGRLAGPDFRVAVGLDGDLRADDLLAVGAHPRFRRPIIRHNLPGVSDRAGLSRPGAPMPVSGSKPSAVVAKQVESKKWRREMAFSGVADLIVIIVAVSCLITAACR